MSYFDIAFVLLFAWSAYNGFKKGFIIKLAGLVALVLGIWGAIEFSDITTKLINPDYYESVYQTSDQELTEKQPEETVEEKLSRKEKRALRRKQEKVKKHAVVDQPENPLVNNTEEKTLTKGQWTPIIAFAITFLLIVIGVHLIARMINKLIKAVELGLINKILGAVFGVAMTAFILSAIMMVVNKIDQDLGFIPQEQKDKSVLYEPMSKFVPAVLPFMNFDLLTDSPSNLDEYKNHKSTENKSTEV